MIRHRFWASVLTAWFLPAVLAAQSPVRITTHEAEDRSPSWSPDSKRLVFASDREGDYEIFSIGTDGNSVERLTENPGPDQSPTWSPSGARVAFQSDRDDKSGLWVMDLADREVRLLFEDSSPELVPDWSPDGRWVAFTSERDGNPDLYRVEVDSGRSERLTENEYRDLWPRHAGDGKSLVFFSRRGTRGLTDDVYLLDLSRASVARVTAHSEHHDFVPDISPDGEQIVAGMSDREANRRELVILDLGGRVLWRLRGNYHRVFHPAWSPNGCWIAYAARRNADEQADLYVVAAPGRVSCGTATMR